MCRNIDRVSRSLLREAGQTITEYAVVLAVVAVSATFLFAELGTNVRALINAAAGLLP